MTNKQLTLHLLKQAGPGGVTTSEFLVAGCGSRFGARVQELRDDGYVIPAKRIRDGSYRYTLVTSPAGHAPSKPEVSEPEPLFTPPPRSALVDRWDAA